MYSITRTLFTTIVTIASFSLVTDAVAQYVGPSNNPSYKSISDVLKNPVDDMEAVLEGTLSKKIGKSKYMFSDGVAEIRVEIDSKHFPVSTLISEKTRVRLHGEIEKDFMESPEIDVKQVTVIN
ncbi:MAG: NirD/YgiW/YdeI family stress tolerance protein [Rhodocyclaceae bacterium]|nr:NirD/YgiW/YdeI family stress tolerance protein [Rhodocyclaceae bacterium]